MNIDVRNYHEEPQARIWMEDGGQCFLSDLFSNITLYPWTLDKRAMRRSGANWNYTGRLRV
jgi:hypothetical protein